MTERASEKIFESGSEVLEIAAHDGRVLDAFYTGGGAPRAFVKDDIFNPE